MVSKYKDENYKGQDILREMISKKAFTCESWNQACEEIAKEMQLNDLTETAKEVLTYKKEN